MKSPIPLVRSLNHASNVVASTSRIPHLKFHILQRQRLRTSTVQNRIYHSATLESSNFATVELKTGVDAENEGTNVHETVTAKPRNLSYDFFKDQAADFETPAEAALDTFESLLEDNVPERTLLWLSSHPAGLDFIDTASVEDFARVFCSLDPNAIFGAFKRTLNAMRFTTLGLRDYAVHDRSLVDRLRRFVPAIENILRRRQESGQAINLEVCRHALRCTAAAGDRKAAATIANNLVPKYNLELDLACYNHLMEVQYTNQSFSTLALSGRAINKHNFELRSQRGRRPPNVRGYGVSNMDPEPEFTLRGEVLQVFQTITQKGIDPNEETFTNLMLGLAKAGDVTGVDSILKSVWNIDIKALDKYDEEELESPTFYTDDHPLRPSHRLLYAIVHAYGSNGDSQRATSILDYASRNYAIDIPLRVWEQLFTWTYANSIRKSARRREQGQAHGSISCKDVELLFEKVIDEPYNISPSPHMLDLLARSFREQRRLDQCLDTIRTIRDQSLPMIELLRQMIHTAQAIQRHPSIVNSNGMPTKDLFAFRHDFQFAFLQALAQLGMLRRQIYRVLTERDWPGSRKAKEWPHCHLPHVVEEFYEHLPLYYSYQTDTGRVRMFRESSRTAGSMSWSTIAQASFVWNALATADPSRMIDLLASMPENLEEAAKGKLQSKDRSRFPESAEATDIALENVRPNMAEEQGSASP